MPADQTPPKPLPTDATKDRVTEQCPLTAAAQRALAEAAARRAERDGKLVEQLKEVHGRGGLDPTRYGDWEVNGLASDF